MPNLTARLEEYFDRLWPICRSITGAGFRKSLDILSELIPVKRLQFHSGQKVLDWIVPNEWNIRDAYLIDPNGEKQCNFQENNLHLVNYSIPFVGKVSLKKLRLHLHSLPNQPNAIPYVTSYYKENWGFCLPHNKLITLPEGEYRVFIDSDLRPGKLEVGEAVLPGESDKEILFSSYLCHPSMANNELSGPLVLAFLYQYANSLPKRRYTYRFLIAPETIGAICYLSNFGMHLKSKLIAGYVLTCLGDKGKFTYKKSRQGESLADLAAKFVLRDFGAHEIVDFFPNDGSDERQFCSPGFNLPVGSLMRTMYSRYPEYHTSLDNKDFISFEALSESIAMCKNIIQALENNYRWKGVVQYGEPQLGRRDLYPTFGIKGQMSEKLSAIYWILNLADEQHDLFDIAKKSKLRLNLLISAAAVLQDAGLIVLQQSKEELDSTYSKVYTQI